MVMIRAAHAAGIPVLYQEVGQPFHPPGFESCYEQFTSVLPLCAEVAALSPQLALECSEKLPTSNISVLPVLIDDKFNLGAGARQRKPLKQGTIFGFAGRLEHLKGPLVLMDAFANTRRQHAAARLRIAGAGSLKHKAMARAKMRGVFSDCEFADVYTHIEDKSSFLQSLDVIVLPSLTEGTPNVIIEAMAYGLPVISTTVGGIPDIVDDESGILVPPGDAQALTQAMCRLAGDPTLRAKMGRAARERYEKLFNPAVVLLLMLDTYRRITTGGGKHPPNARPDGSRLLHPWAQSADLCLAEEDGGQQVIDA
jgi:glycosyltransferase involved in cell wall biosynthesis